MSKQRSTTVPSLMFGSGRTGKLALSVGKRGRVGIKGDCSFSRLEARAFVSQLQWFLSQVETMDTTAAPANGTASTPTIPGLLYHDQLSLPLTGDVRSAED